jgi:hypothetical protein
MNFWFKDWRECSQDLIPMDLDEDALYYMQARAWHIKGYLGGTHSWTTFYSKSDKAWMVAEYTDRETLSYQGGEIIYDGNPTLNDFKHAPYIATRPCNAQWFGADPYIVDVCKSPSYETILKACQEFPYNEFRLLDLNCNTFTSYLHWKLGLHLRQPLRSIGYKNKDWWQARHK